MNYFIETKSVQATNKLQRQAYYFSEQLRHRTVNDPQKFLEYIKESIESFNKLFLSCNPINVSHNFDCTEAYFKHSSRNIWLKYGNWYLHINLIKIKKDKVY